MTSSDDTQQSYDPYVEALRAKARSRRLGMLRPQLRQGVKLLRSVGRGAIGVIFGIQLVQSLGAAAQVVVAKIAFSHLLNHPTIGAALPPLIAFVLINTLVAALGVYQAQRQVLLSELVVRQSWDRLLEVTVSVPLEMFEDSTYYDRLQRIRTNALTKPLQVVQGLITLIGAAIAVIGLIIALLAIQPIVVPILLIAVVPMLLIAKVGGRVEFDFAIAQTQNMRQRYALLDLMTDRAAAKEIRAFELGDHLQARHTALYDDYVAALRTKVATKNRLSLLSGATTALIACGAVAILVSLVSDGRVSLSEAGAAVVAIGLLAGRIEQIFKGIAALLESGLFLRDLDDFLQLGRSDQAGSPVSAIGFEQLRVKDLSFVYPGRQRPALDDVSLTINRGEVIAVVGPNGSGKTTLSKLLANLYAPTAGSIRWDDTEVNDLDPHAVSSSIAVLFQDFVRYELSLFDNVSLGDTTRAKDVDGVIAAADTAGAGPIARNLPNGFDTLLSTRFPAGVDLSTGQWQRVAMARALFRDAPFVILDEPTAALDARAELELYRAVKTLLAGRTVLLVTHRIASAMEADRILVIEGGRIIESGSHDELIDRSGHYAEMFELQSAAFSVKLASG